jgi:RNA polymerase sigma-70 factor, ECF subfamily
MGDSSSTPTTSESLLICLRDAQDTQAWALFVELYTPLVYRYCRRRGLQDSDSQDVTQEVLIRFSKAVRSFQYDPSKGRFRSWLGTMTHNLISAQQAKDARPDRAPGHGAAETLLFVEQAAEDPLWVDDFNRQTLQTALSRIRPEFDDATWRAFELTWLADQPPLEVAAQLGKPAAWIYKAKFRVLLRLKQEVQFLAADVGFLQKE